ncbi:MAG TPA: hypothetical protein VFQ72_01385 [Candidatus Paceibacterota bacterium]|nr:hypothetical protein [Candidatus Paceibacterota bacterium]
MKRSLLGLLIISSALSSAAPINARAQEAATSDPVVEAPAQESAPAPATIRANLSVRYQGSLAWTGQVALVQGSTAAISDSSGLSHSIASDSALQALAAADSFSPDFSLSDLTYYSDYGSFFINCIDIAALPKHACGNWQYVVNSDYPQIGVDKYAIHEGDTLYFYYGNPRRVTVQSGGSAEAPATVHALAEKYDYTTDTWTPLPGASVGATQPNPNDPYSPIVAYSAVSGPDGVAAIAIAQPGDYGIGLATDYYYPAEPITIRAAQAAAAAQRTSSSSNGGSWSAGGSAPAAATSTPTAASIPPQAISTPSIAADIPAIISEEPMITLDISWEAFAARYTLLASANTTRPAPAAVKPVTQTASVFQAMKAASTTAPAGTGWLDRIIRFFTR